MPGRVDRAHGETGGGFALLVALWIVVYWWWEPSEPPIRFDPTQAVVQESTTPGATAPNGQGLPPGSSDSSEPPPGVTPNEPGKPGDSNKSGVGALEVKPAGKTKVVIAPEFTEYQVQPGDTFERIARKTLGASSKAGIIARANPFVDPSRLKPGRTLKIPKDAENLAGKTVEIAAPKTAAGPNKYKVESGDTLSGISERVYGESKYADLIFQANREHLASKHDLKIGQELVIPPKPQP